MELSLVHYARPGAEGEVLPHRRLRREEEKEGEGGRRKKYVNANKGDLRRITVRSKGEKAAATGLLGGGRRDVNRDIRRGGQKPAPRQIAAE